MTIGAFLRSRQFIDDPFASTNAAAEPRLADYFVPPAYFISVLGEPTTPESSLVFAPRGGGKTAQRRMVEDFAADTGSFLCVTYDVFELGAGFRVEDADLSYHLSQICRILLVALLLKLDQDSEVANLLGARERTLIKFQVKRFLGEVSAADFETAIRSIKSRPERVKDWLSKYALPKILIDAVSAKLGLGRLSLASETFERQSRDESMRFHFGRLVEMLQMVGYPAIYVLVDGVDELPITTDAKASFHFIRPLLLDLPTLETPGAAFKLFLWDQIEDLYREGGGRPDRLRDYRLRWTVGQLTKMMSKRLRAFSSNGVHSLKSLKCPSLVLNLDQLLAYLAWGSPRDMIRLAGGVVAEQANRSPQTTCIGTHALWAALRKFARTRTRELFNPTHVEQLTKIGGLTFTISHIANDIFRISDNAARSKVQNWQDAGLVTKIGEVPGGRRPQYLYGVTDVRMAIVMAPTLDVNHVLDEFVLLCPVCKWVCISDREIIDCPECGRRFKRDSAPSLIAQCGPPRSTRSKAKKRSRRRKRRAG